MKPGGPLRRMWGLSGHPLVHNAAALYGVQAATLLIPLLTVPYLARVLGPASLGLLAFSQGFGQFITIVVEYGFTLSGTREVAQNRADGEARSRILGGVLGAKAVLSLLAVGASVICFFLIPMFRDRPEFLVTATCWGIAQGFSLTWYFQGIERLRLVASVEVGARVLAMIAIFATVSGPVDSWKVLLLQGMAALGALTINTMLVRRDARISRPSRTQIVETLRLGGSMFLFRGAVSLYTVANAFILGLLAAPSAVGFYSGAERVTRAVVAMLGPISQTVFPRISALVVGSRQRAAVLTIRSLILISGIAFGAFLALSFGAETVVRIALGSEFEPSVTPLRIMAALPVLIGLSNVLGIQWMVPLRLDWSFNKIVLIGGLLNVTLAIFLGSAFEAKGMAVAVVATEFFITAAICVVLKKKHLFPWTVRKSAADAKQPNASG